MVTIVVIEDSQLWRKMRIMMMQVFFPDPREKDVDVLLATNMI